MDLVRQVCHDNWQHNPHDARACECSAEVGGEEVQHRAGDGCDHELLHDGHEDVVERGGREDVRDDGADVCGEELDEQVAYDSGDLGTSSW